MQESRWRADGSRTGALPPFPPRDGKAYSKTSSGVSFRGSSQAYSRYSIFAFRCRPKSENALARAGLLLKLDDQTLPFIAEHGATHAEILQ